MAEDRGPWKELHPHHERYFHHNINKAKKNQLRSKSCNPNNLFCGYKHIINKWKIHVKSIKSALTNLLSHLIFIICVCSIGLCSVFVKYQMFIHMINY